MTSERIVVQHSRLSRQDGFVREIIKYFLVFLIILVVILDGVSVLQAQVSVRDNAASAASDARTQFVEGANTEQTLDVARSYLTAKDAQYVSAYVTESTSRDDVVVTVRARREAHTYVFHYLEKAPWGLGDRVQRLLNPTATRSSH